MALRTMRTAEQWRRLLAEYHESGEAANVFCERHKIHTTTLYGKLRKETANNKPQPRLLPVVEREALPIDSVEITLPKGTTLRFSPGTQPSYIAAILKGIG